MTSQNGATRPIPRIESLRIRNYRVLKDVHLKKLTPLTVLIGPNGSGKSTIFDAFAFLAECLVTDPHRAMRRRGGMRELRSRGQSGNIAFELRYREQAKAPLITYSLEFGIADRHLIVERERLSWQPKTRKRRPQHILDYRRGDGYAIQGVEPDGEAEENLQPLASPDLLALNTFGQFREHSHAAGLRRFITNWHFSHLSTQDMAASLDSAPSEHLSAVGDNLANVLRHLDQTDEDRLNNVFADLARQVPQFERAGSSLHRDGTLLLKLKDRAFDEPIPARFASDGTLKMLAHLVLLSDPDPPPLIGIEEPENFIHPGLLYRLSERCQIAADRTQLLVTSHAPRFVDALLPQQVLVLHRGDDGFTQVRTAVNINGIREYLTAGGLVGSAWEQRMLDLPSKAQHAS